VTAGRLVVFEGPEGVGKTTQVRRLAERLAVAGEKPVTVREPGGTPVGDEIRRLLLDSDRQMTAAAEALLFMASRAELVRSVIEPALRAGRMVLMDRFFLSTYAYQVDGRGLPEADVVAANRLATEGIAPDLTLLLDAPVADGLARADRRGNRDRMERAEDEFHERVASAFRRFADTDWQRTHPECGAVVRIDARGTEQEVTTRVTAVLAARWPETFSALTQLNA
jgi:dTMP kinase